LKQLPPSTTQGELDQICAGRHQIPQDTLQEPKPTMIRYPHPLFVDSVTDNGTNSMASTGLRTFNPSPHGGRFETSYLCNIPPCSSTKVTSATLHNAVYHLHQCSICRVPQSSARFLHIHMLECHDSYWSAMAARANMPVWECPWDGCENLRFWSESERKAHQRTMHGGNGRKRICDHDTNEIQLYPASNENDSQVAMDICTSPNMSPCGYAIVDRVSFSCKDQVQTKKRRFEFPSRAAAQQV